MKIFWIISGGVAIVGLIIVAIVGFGSGSGQKQIAGYTTDDVNAPKVEMLERKYDFGNINLNDIARHDFKIINNGKNPLVISGLVTSCHCTSAVFKVAGQDNSPEFGMHVDSSWRGEIPAGGQADLEVIYRPAVMPVKGAVSRVITFSTNDPSNKEIQTEITADVQ